MNAAAAKPLGRKLPVVLMLAADLLALAAGFHLAYATRTLLLPWLFAGGGDYFFPIFHFYRMAYLLGAFPLAFAARKLYSRRFHPLEEFLAFAQGLLLAVGGIVALVFVTRSFERFSRTIPLLMILYGLILLPLGRRLVERILRLFPNSHATLVIADSHRPHEVPGYARTLWAAAADLPDGEGLNEYVRRRRIHRVILAEQETGAARLGTLIPRLQGLGLEIIVVPSVLHLIVLGVTPGHWNRFALLSPLYARLKRGSDFLLAAIVLLLSAPLFLAVSLAIRAGSRGPVFFRQERIGRDGRVFRLVKFRTMYTDSDRLLQEYLRRHPERRLEWNRFKKLKSGDPRVTPIGRWLRRWSLDELPQLVHVVRGEMSLVGPRPYLPVEKEEIEQSAVIIFRARAGLTGLWQIAGRNDLDFQARVRLDEFYVLNWSFHLDLLILLKTFGAVLRGRGAY